MNQRTLAGSKPAELASASRGVLRRVCACGQHSNGGECESCRQKREGSWSRVAVVAPNRESFGARAVKVPGAPTNKFDDCPAGWQKEAEAALVRGRSWVANVVNGLTSLPNPIPAPVATLLNRHFHTTFSGDIKKIVGHYQQISKAMNASIHFECETSCDKDEVAYVYSFWTHLHLCPVWHGLSAAEQADTVIHELAHDAAGRDDEAYIWEPKYKTLSVDEAIDNADSYSSFAREAS